MAVRLILPSLYVVRLGVVNAFVIEDDNDLILIDTGYRRHARAVLRAVDQIGGGRKQLRHFVVTHSHPDHSGSLAEIKRRTPARAYMHAADAAMVRAGQIALLWERHSGVLFLGDAASNLPALRLAFVHENLAEGLASLRKLAALRFEHACFGHGRPILGRADERFARRFGSKRPIISMDRCR